MNAQKEYFIALLSCFMSGTRPQGREADFEELYRLADIHDVGAIIATELKEVAPAFQPQGKLASHFTQAIGLTLREFQHRETAQRIVKALLDGEHIDHLFVKGAVIKSDYPVPELRTSGDIDVIVRKTDFEKVVSLAEHTAVPLTVKEQTSEVVTWKLNGIDVEIHSTADVSSDYFNDIMALAIRQDGYTYRLSDTDHLLYIICHLAKHLAYRGAGIRMLMDVDVLVRKLQPFDQSGFLILCENAGCKKTAEALLSLAAFWFGTPVTATVDYPSNPLLLQSFERVMLDGGSFGYEQNAIPVRYLDHDGSTEESRLKILLKMAFPSREYLKLCYPYYQKYAFLYPVARLNRLADGLFKKRKAAADVLQQVKTDGGNASVQLALIRELEINYKK